MAAMGTYFGTRTGVMAMVPEGKDDQIKWPHGTRFMQCRKAPSGHWLLMVSCWRQATSGGGPPSSL